MTVKVPETVGYLHYWSIQTTRSADKEEVLDALRASSRILLLEDGLGLGAMNSVKELMADSGGSRSDLYEVALGQICSG
jgi:glyceraldehyde-3-phosphate dehydrogenase (NAD(P))